MICLTRFKMHWNKGTLPKFSNLSIIGIILMVALMLRLYNLDKYTLWFDESLVVLDNRGLDKLPSLTKLFDENFVIYNHDYLTLYSHGFIYYWQKLFGSSEFTLRLSSVVFSLASILALYVLAKKVFGIKIANIASFLLAVAPFHIYYAQELRPYAGICFFSIIAALYFIKMTGDNKKIYWFIYGIVNILNIYFLHVALMILFTFALFFIINLKKYKHLWRRFIITHVLIILCVVPVILTLYPNLIFLLHNRLDSPSNELPILGAENSSAKQLLYSLKNFAIGYGQDYYSGTGKFITLLYFIIFCMGIFKFIKSKEKQLFLYCLFIPLLIKVSIFHCYVDRYIFLSYPFFVLVIASGLNTLDRRLLYNALILIIIFNFLGLRNYYLNYLPADGNQRIAVYKKQDVRDAAGFIIDNYQSGDRIANTCKNTVFPLKLYTRENSKNLDLIQEIGRGTVIFQSTLIKNGDLYIFNYDLLHPVVILPKDYLSAKTFLQEAKRLWLVVSFWDFVHLKGALSQSVEEIGGNFSKIEKSKEFKGGILYLFSKTD
jgi:4-amino-4-deoxy-L-arabinose transferase-like glycosyltransferase